jgi:hypothetical protein
MSVDGGGVCVREKHVAEILIATPGKMSGETGFGLSLDELI